MKTAQILIVGDELLSGRTADTNSNYLAKNLFLLGIRVQKIEVIADSLVLISQWIRLNRGLSDFVFVCGGIGGTPDDVTRAAVGRAFDLPLVRNPEAEQILLKHYGDRINAERMSMADLPASCELIENSVTRAPGFRLENVFVFAGIPKILHVMFESIKHLLDGDDWFETELKLEVGEGDIARHMKELSSQFPMLELGSYPTLDENRGYKTQLVFRAQEKTIVDQAVSRFRKMTGL